LKKKHFIVKKRKPLPKAVLRKPIFVEKNNQPIFMARMPGNYHINPVPDIDEKPKKKRTKIPIPDLSAY
jgi:hypothetical protein